MKDSLIFHNDKYSIYNFFLFATTVFAQSSQTSTQQLQQQHNSFCKLTESDILGPFYKEDAPFKQRIDEGSEGE
jgi:hypothetical protein